MLDLKGASENIYINIAQIMLWEPEGIFRYLSGKIRDKEQNEERWSGMRKVGVGCTVLRHSVRATPLLIFCVRFYLKKNPCTSRNINNITTTNKDLKSSSQMSKFSKQGNQGSERINNLLNGTQLEKVDCINDS